MFLLLRGVFGNGERMKRRQFVGLVAGTVAWPLLAHAEPVRRIGVLLGNTEGDPQSAAGMSAFRQAMQELGWTEGRNLQIDLRFAEECKAATTGVALANKTSGLRSTNWWASIWMRAL